MRFVSSVTFLRVPSERPRTSQSDWSSAAVGCLLPAACKQGKHLLITA